MLKEKRRLDFSSKNEEEYNLPFSVMNEEINYIKYSQY